MFFKAVYSFRKSKKKCVMMFDVDVDVDVATTNKFYKLEDCDSQFFIWLYSLD